MVNTQNTLSRQTILSKAVDRLRKLYISPPSSSFERIEKELEYIERNMQFIDLAKVLEIKSISTKYNLPLLLNGTGSGSFFLFLLGVSNYNSLPAHYVCKSCGRFEWSKESLFGIDLPKKSCEDCNCEMRKDGYNVPIHSIWQKGEGELHFDFLTVPILVDFCKPILNDDSLEITLAPSEELEEIKWLSEATFEIPSHLQIDDGKAISFVNSRAHKKLPFISTCLIDSYMTKQSPIKIEQIVKLYSAENSSYSDGYSAEEYLIEQNRDANEYIYDREDIYGILVKMGIDENEAALVSTAIRKGKGRESLIRSSVELPSWLYDLADNVKYLFPRAHSISRIIVALQAAEYRDKFPYEYEKYHQYDIYRTR